ncbi:MAG: phosphotransferase [Dehalococcoidia bacterium]|nr:phosphotransferase [Dehalococcoidia bacterium]
MKVGADIPRYQVMASLDLTPAVIVRGYLADGTSILVQHYVDGRNPSRQDFCHLLDRIASVVNKVHHSPALKSILPPGESDTYRDAALAAARRVQHKWEGCRALVPAVADYLDDALSCLKQDIKEFAGSGLVASHNDICNSNWLIAPDGNVYLVDLEAMSLDDPAHDMGSLLWWYYPPELRPDFLTRAGYEYDEAFRSRMRARMALHCLDILLPRPRSFDRFDPDVFAEELADFRAVCAGRENPQGYAY